MIRTNAQIGSSVPLRALPLPPAVGRGAAVVPFSPVVAGGVQQRPERPPAPLETVYLSALGADLLLPGSFELYRERLKQSGIFSDEETRLLDALPTDPSPPPDSNQPVVGIILNEPAAFLGNGGVRELCAEMRELGCRVLLIPPCADLLMPEDPVGRVHGMRSMLKRLDGLIGPGGHDVDPSIYGQPNRHARTTNARRDRFEADFALLAKTEDLFMFGICRSHQLWNAADGGDLVQDIQAEGLASRSRNQKKYGIPRDRPLVLEDERGRVLFENRVHLDPHSRMADVTRETEFVTNAFHHQAVEEPGEDLEVVGHVHDPGTGRDQIEATERWNAFTVQWHPEAMTSDPVQRRLLGTVARRAALFHASKRLAAEGKPITAQSLNAWALQFGWLDQSDARWVRAELIPHLYGSRPMRATKAVNGR